MLLEAECCHPDRKRGICCAAADRKADSPRQYTALVIAISQKARLKATANVGAFAFRKPALFSLPLFWRVQLPSANS
jgi:hypothetical protein